MSRQSRVVNEVPKREKQITVPQPTDHPQDHTHKVSHALKIKIDHLKTFDALTDNQQKFFDSYKRGDYFIALHGVAGTGKCQGEDVEVNLMVSDEIYEKLKKM